jgi:ubiquinone/menaquinone biosynthesis C-methylase UbiE
MGQVEQVQRVFDEWANNGRAEGMERGHGPTAIQAFNRLGLKGTQRYLDVGCGNGYTLRWALERAPQAELWGIDVASEMISLAKRMTNNESVRFIAGEFPNESLPTNYFDAVFSMEVLYYLPSIDQGLNAVANGLRPGGLFACVVDYYEEHKESHSWPSDTGVDMTLWSADQWREGFKRAGFEVVEQKRLFPVDAESQGKESAGSLMTLGRKK